MKKIWYLAWLVIFSILGIVIYKFIVSSDQKSIQLMLIFVGLVILARILITPLVAIIVHRRDQKKEKESKVDENNEQR
ncbi:hypothetical protein R4B61_06270 [Fructilactobacillus vespulae]|uniref:hypothetical protein n=1 Tax=Fructilactobacillus vespulae TaxID=1249630 RepID=UPI0039B45290